MRIRNDNIPLDLSVSTSLHNSPHIAQISHDSKIPKRESRPRKSLIQSPPQPLCLLVSYLRRSRERVPLHDGDVAQREDVLHRGHRGSTVQVLDGRGARDELRAEVIVDEEAPGLGIAFEDPFFVSGWCGCGTFDCGGGGRVDMHMVEGLLDERVHHEAW